MKARLLIGLATVFIVGIFGLTITKLRVDTRRDFRVAYVNDDEVVVKSISWQRKMVNIVRIDGDVQMWIPGGLGWYEANKLRKLLAQEKQESRIGEVLFYNLGFDSELIIFDKENEQRDFWQIANKWGWGNYLQYVLNGTGGLMIKEEKIRGQLSGNSEILGTIMLRDMADSGVVEDDIRVSLINTGMANGLANFMARNLEWAGVTIYGVETNVHDLGGAKCLLEYGENVGKSRVGQLLFKHLGVCDKRENQLVGSGDVEIYLSDKYAEMLNYLSYNEVKY